MYVNSWVKTDDETIHEANEEMLGVNKAEPVGVRNTNNSYKLYTPFSHFFPHHNLLKLESQNCQWNNMSVKKKTINFSPTHTQHCSEQRLWCVAQCLHSFGLQLIKTNTESSPVKHVAYIVQYKQQYEITCFTSVMRLLVHDFFFFTFVCCTKWAGVWF